MNTVFTFDPDSAAPAPVQHYVFALLDGFCQVGFSTFVEALSLANHCNRAPVFTWTTVSETGAPVANSVHVPTAVNGRFDPVDRNSTIVLCGGSDPKRALGEQLLAWLRREHRRGVPCGALGSGVFTLARTGLLNGRGAVVHWGLQNAFREYFPQVEIRDGIFCVEDGLFTSVGRAATLDLAIHLIARFCDSSVSSDVAEHMVYAGRRQPDSSQRLSVQARYGSRNPNLMQALKIMADNLETPVPPPEIARRLGISKRQLERLFKSKIGISPKSYYIKMRLQKARSLMLQTDLKVAEVACACGFGSLPHFSKSYQKAFGVSPSKDTVCNGLAPAEGICEPAAAARPQPAPGFTVAVQCSR